MNNTPENPIYTNFLLDAIRNQYNVNEKEAMMRNLELARTSYGEDEPALLTPELESQIDNGVFGAQIKAVYLRFLQNCEEPLSNEQNKFLQDHRDLLY